MVIGPVDCRGDLADREPIPFGVIHPFKVACAFKEEIGSRVSQDYHLHSSGMKGSDCLSPKTEGSRRSRLAESSSEPESSGSDSDSEPDKKRRHHAHRSHIEPKKTLIVLKAVSHRIRSCAKATKTNIFVGHPDSGASNHMTHRRELFDSDSFKILTKPIPISLGDNSKIFVTRKGALHKDLGVVS
jgi:hypothetical protein